MWFFSLSFSDSLPTVASIVIPKMYLEDHEPSTSKLNTSLQVYNNRSFTVEHDRNFGRRCLLQDQACSRSLEWSPEMTGQQRSSICRDWSSHQSTKTGAWEEGHSRSWADDGGRLSWGRIIAGLSHPGSHLCETDFDQNDCSCTGQSLWHHKAYWATHGDRCHEECHPFWYSSWRREDDYSLQIYISNSTALFWYWTHESRLPWCGLFLELLSHIVHSFKTEISLLPDFIFSDNISFFVSRLLSRHLMQVHFYFS